MEYTHPADLPTSQILEKSRCQEHLLSLAWLSFLRVEKDSASFIFKQMDQLYGMVGTRHGLLIFNYSLRHIINRNCCSFAHIIRNFLLVTCISFYNLAQFYLLLLPSRQRAPLQRLCRTFSVYIIHVCLLHEMILRECLM